MSDSSLGGTATPRAARPRPQQRDVEQYLRRLIGDGTRQFYSDGCRILDGTSELETSSHMLTHCARELESAVREVLMEVLRPRALDHDCGFDDDTELTHADEIRAIVDALGQRPDVAALWIGVVTGRSYGRQPSLATSAHRRGLERARRLDEQHERRWSDLEDLLLILMPALEPLFVQVLEELRKLAALQKPTTLERGRFLRLSGTYVAREQFYAIASPGWLPLLASKGLFEHIEDGFLLDLASGQEDAHHSAALSYLARTAGDPSWQREFMRITKDLPLPHEWAALDLLKGAAALPQRMRAEYAATAKGWVEKQPRVWLYATDAAEFSARLIREGEVAAAIGLADALLHIDGSRSGDAAEEPEMTPRAEPIGRLDDYEFEQVLKKVGAALIAVDPWKAFTWSLDRLERILELSERSSRVARRADSSATWRPTIAAGQMHYGHDYANALVDVVRDAAMAAARTSEDARARVSRALRDSGWTVSRRIAIHIAKELTR